jgi:hypothetical protein
VDQLRGEAAVLYQPFNPPKTPASLKADRSGPNIDLTGWIVKTLGKVLPAFDLKEKVLAQKVFLDTDLRKAGLK